MNRKRIETLIDNYLEGNCTPKEKLWIEDWLKDKSNGSEWQWKSELHKREVQANIFQQLDEEVGRIEFKRKRRNWGIGGIAATVLLICTLLVWEASKDMNMNNQALEAENFVVMPGTKAATLKLANGETIYLDDQEEALVSQLGNIKISKTSGGRIEYKATSGLASDDLMNTVTYNTLVVPRGGQYELTLSDGTKIWLNSETTLIYPTAFLGKERRIHLVGEAYFEVAKELDKPFIVQGNEIEVKVLGTHFNVAAYEGAGIENATLVEGSVEVSNGKQKVRLVPGQQVISNGQENGLHVREVTVSDILSWKEGYFSFDYQELTEVMEQVARWYNIEYTIIGKSEKTEKLGGTFSRSKSLDELLMYLEQLLQVTIERDGRRLKVMY